MESDKKTTGKKVVISIIAIIILAFVIGGINNPVNQDNFDVTERATDLSGDLDKVTNNDGEGNTKASYNVISGAISITRVKGPAFAKSNNNSYLGFCSKEAPKEAGGTKFECIDSKTEYRLSAKVENDLYICTSHDLDSGKFAKLTEMKIPPVGYSCK